jgi:prophage regulatory protein
MKTAAITPDRITLLRKPAVRQRVPLSDTTLWRRVKDGTFPKPVRISTNAVAWRETDIDDWIAKQK